MGNDRLTQLLGFLKDEPNDPFNLYALALEYTNIDENKALEYFNKLLQEHETYIPTYYHAAKLYEMLEESEKAREIYEKGLEMSKKMHDNHANQELQRAYEQFRLEEDF